MGFLARRRFEARSALRSNLKPSRVPHFLLHFFRRRVVAGQRLAAHLYGNSRGIHAQLRKPREFRTKVRVLTGNRRRRRPQGGGSRLRPLGRSVVSHERVARSLFVGGGCCAVAVGSRKTGAWRVFLGWVARWGAAHRLARCRPLCGPCGL